MVKVVTERERVGRNLRKPNCPFHLRDVSPFAIQPMLCHPVLAGETMTSLLLQSRVVTDPLAERLIGAWCEYYFFYVKLRDLDGRADFEEMIVDPEKSMSSYDGTTDGKHFFLANPGSDIRIDWVDLCLKRVTETYFRAEGEAWDDAKYGTLPVAMINSMNVADNLAEQDNVLQEADDDLTSTTAGQGDGTSAVKVSEIDLAMREWQMKRMHRVTDMTFADYLKAQGVTAETAPLNEPELLRYIKDWTYPTNTIDPTDGSATTACSWSLQERADKDRYFREPGFIFGVQIIRPKVYFSYQRSTAIGLMNDAFSWLPTQLDDDPYSSLALVTTGDTPFTSPDADYVFDRKDLFMYGEQFLNFDPAGANDKGAIQLPTINEGLKGVNSKYPTSTMIDSVFSDTVTNKYVQTDGVVQLNILSRLEDTTPDSLGNPLFTT